MATLPSPLCLPRRSLYIGFSLIMCHVCHLDHSTTPDLSATSFTFQPDPPPPLPPSLSLSLSLSLSPRTPRSPPPPVQEMTLHAEECLRRLGLPYRKVALCAGDVGFSAQVRLLLNRHNSSVAKCTLYIYIYIYGGRRFLGAVPFIHVT